MSERALIAFRQVRGHDRVCGMMRTAVAGDRLAHTLLFAGTEGIGKRTVALALAAWMQCDARGDDACGDCASCRQVAAASHPDVLLVGLTAGKKEIGVERARDLKRFMHLRPMHGRAKIAIVDDAQLLTVAAQNALLKTLEEPPPRSTIVLIASMPDALLATVRSRCQRVSFRPLPEAVIVELLLRAHALDADTARTLAALAEGSLGRALALRAGILPGQSEQLAQQVAQLSGARYFDVVNLAAALGQPESDLATQMELLLAQCRDTAVRHAGAAADLQRTLRRGDAIHEAWQAVRWGNPNRQLLLEGLLLRLARL